MDVVGKILIALSDNTISEIKAGLKYGDRERYLNSHKTLTAGSMALCVEEYSPAKDARAKRMPTIPFYVLLHNEKFWEVPPAEYDIAQISEILKGKKVCFTGKHRFTSRPYWRVVVENAGGEYDEGVTKATSLLITENLGTMSTKAENARKFGVPLMTYVNFYRMLKENS